MYSYKEYNEPIQALIKLMHRDYPNGFELRINGFGAEKKQLDDIWCKPKYLKIGNQQPSLEQRKVRRSSRNGVGFK